jgi:hypothetical protein
VFSPQVWWILGDVLECQRRTDGVEDAGGINGARLQVDGVDRRRGRIAAGLAEHAQAFHTRQLAADLFQHLKMAAFLIYIN